MGYIITIEKIFRELTGDDKLTIVDIDGTVHKIIFTKRGDDESLINFWRLLETEITKNTSTASTDFIIRNKGIGTGTFNPTLLIYNLDALWERCLVKSKIGRLLELQTLLQATFKEETSRDCHCYIRCKKLPRTAKIEPYIDVNTDFSELNLKIPSAIYEKDIDTITRKLNALDQGEIDEGPEIDSADGHELMEEESEAIDIPASFYEIESSLQHHVVTFLKVYFDEEGQDTASATPSTLWDMTLDDIDLRQKILTDAESVRTLSSSISTKNYDQIPSDLLSCINSELDKFKKNIEVNDAMIEEYIKLDKGDRESYTEIELYNLPLTIWNQIQNLTPAELWQKLTPSIRLPIAVEAITNKIIETYMQPPSFECIGPSEEPNPSSFTSSGPGCRR